ncbi:hypothetical protein Tsubulata_008988 [Turnera subulata]|uniref:Uncharacterized protein n=1 Tax=Turnera subulata TaxID=218843 RepID=A0A9Q0FIN3_9ROSI|nr:hypothetical protein Tsubulata_008988 [Turnera subulata]
MPGKVGSRAEHLGLHKALCVMMGWENKEHQNGQWTRRLLPLVEAVFLQEDLIIWPPAVVVHNISIANNNPGDRIIVSIDELTEILKGAYNFSVLIGTVFWSASPIPWGNASIFP